MIARKYGQPHYSLARAALAVEINRSLEGYEAECSAEITSLTGRKPRGFWLPLDASVRSDLTTSTGAGAVPTRLQMTPIQTLRARSIVGSLGGQFVELVNPDNSVAKTRLPRAAASTIVSYAAEGAAQPNPVLTTTLNGAVTDSATSITVASVAGLPVNCTIFSLKVESEIMLVVAVDDVTKILTVRRGQFGTLAAAHADATAVATLGMLVDNVEYTPRTLTAIVDVPRKAMVSIGPAAIDLVVGDILGAFAAEIDRSALSGKGTGEEPQGMIGDARIPTAASLGTNGGPPTRAALVAVEKAVGIANGDASAIPLLGWATSPAGRAKLRSTFQVGSTFPKYLWSDENQMLGYPAAASNNIPSNLTKAGGSNLTALVFGDWSQSTVATWRAIDVLINPFFNSATMTRITCFLEFDFQIRQPSGFAKIVDLDPS